MPPQKLLLERVIGATVDQYSCAAWNSITGELAYPAGSVIVCYNPRQNKQTRFVYGRANRAISCLAFSPNGKYLAAGETGKRPAVLIWDLQSGHRIACLKGHSYGIRQVCFSSTAPHHQLISLGDEHDGSLMFWDYSLLNLDDCSNSPGDVNNYNSDNSDNRSNNKPNNNNDKGTSPANPLLYKTQLPGLTLTVDWSMDGSYYVTAGHKHICAWKVHDRTGRVLTKPVPTSFNIDLHKDAIFTNIKCGTAKCVDRAGNSSSSAEGMDDNHSMMDRIWALTSTGILCVFRCKKHITPASISASAATSVALPRLSWNTSKWVDMRLGFGLSMSINNGILAVSGLHGKVRLFNSETLSHLFTLPRPHPLVSQPSTPTSSCDLHNPEKCTSKSRHNNYNGNGNGNGNGSTKTTDAVTQLLNKGHDSSTGLKVHGSNKSSSSNSSSSSNEIIVAASSNRCISRTDTASGRTGTNSNGMGKGKNALVYPDVPCLVLNTSGTKLAACLSDHGLMVWDVKNVLQHATPRLSRSFLHHSDCIWDLQVTSSSQVPPLSYQHHLEASTSLLNTDTNQSDENDDRFTLPEGTFITCSQDNTIRAWNIDINTSNLGTNYRNNRNNNPSSHSSGPASTPVSSQLSSSLVNFTRTKDRAKFRWSNEMISCVKFDSPSSKRALLLSVLLKHLPAGMNENINTLMSQFRDKDTVNAGNGVDMRRNDGGGDTCLSLICDYLQTHGRVNDKNSARRSASRSSSVPSYVDVRVDIQTQVGGVRCIQLLDSYDSALGSKCIIASGDRQGNMWLHDIGTAKALSCTRAHEKEVRSLTYTPSPMPLLASGSRDGLIHLFDVTSAVDNERGENSSEKGDVKMARIVDPPIHTLPAHSQHTSAVTGVAFTRGKCKTSNDVASLKLISCSADKAVLFRSVEAVASSPLPSIECSTNGRTVVKTGTIHDLAVHPNNKFVVTCGQDKHLRIWNLHTGKHSRSYKAAGGGSDDNDPGGVRVSTSIDGSFSFHSRNDDSRGYFDNAGNAMKHSTTRRSSSSNIDLSEPIRVSLDPAGIMAVTSSSDKYIRVYDWFSGSLLEQVFGHSKTVTSVKFTSDCKRVISTSADGTIFIWKVCREWLSAMREGLEELHNDTESKDAMFSVTSFLNGDDDQELGGGSQDDDNHNTSLFSVTQYLKGLDNDGNDGTNHDRTHDNAVALGSRDEDGNEEKYVGHVDCDDKNNDNTSLAGHQETESIVPTVPTSEQLPSNDSTRKPNNAEDYVHVDVHDFHDDYSLSSTETSIASNKGADKYETVAENDCHESQSIPPVVVPHNKLPGPSSPPATRSSGENGKSNVVQEKNDSPTPDTESSNENTNDSCVINATGSEEARPSSSRSRWGQKAITIYSELESDNKIHVPVQCVRESTLTAVSTSSISSFPHTSSSSSSSSSSRQLSYAAAAMGSSGVSNAVTATATDSNPSASSKSLGNSKEGTGSASARTNINIIHVNSDRPVVLPVKQALRLQRNFVTEATLKAMLDVDAINGSDAGKICEIDDGKHDSDLRTLECSADIVDTCDVVDKENTEGSCDDAVSMAVPSPNSMGSGLLRELVAQQEEDDMVLTNGRVVSIADPTFNAEETQNDVDRNLHAPVGVHKCDLSSGREASAGVRPAIETRTSVTICDLASKSEDVDDFERLFSVSGGGMFDVKASCIFEDDEDDEDDEDVEDEEDVEDDEDDDDDDKSEGAFIDKVDESKDDEMSATRHIPGVGAAAPVDVENFEMARGAGDNRNTKEIKSQVRTAGEIESSNNKMLDKGDLASSGYPAEVFEPLQSGDMKDEREIDVVSVNKEDCFPPCSTSLDLEITLMREKMASMGLIQNSELCSRGLAFKRLIQNTKQNNMNESGSTSTITGCSLAALSLPLSPPSLSSSSSPSSSLTSPLSSALGIAVAGSSMPPSVSTSSPQIQTYGNAIATLQQSLTNVIELYQTLKPKPLRSSHRGGDNHTDHSDDTHNHHDNINCSQVKSVSLSQEHNDLLFSMYETCLLSMRDRIERTCGAKQLTASYKLSTAEPLDTIVKPQVDKANERSCTSDSKASNGKGTIGHNDDRVARINDDDSKPQSSLISGTECHSRGGTKKGARKKWNTPPLITSKEHILGEMRDMGSDDIKVEDGNTTDSTAQIHSEHDARNQRPAEHAWASTDSTFSPSLCATLEKYSDLLVEMVKNKMDEQQVYSRPRPPTENDHAYSDDHERETDA